MAPSDLIAGRISTRFLHDLQSICFILIVLHESGFQQSRSPSSPFREFILPVLQNQRTQHSIAQLEHLTSSRRYQRGRLTIIFARILTESTGLQSTAGSTSRITTCSVTATFCRVRTPVRECHRWQPAKPHRSSTYRQIRHLVADSSETQK